MRCKKRMLLITETAAAATFADLSRFVVSKD